MKKILLIIFSIFLFIGIYAQDYKTYRWEGSLILDHSSGDTILVSATVNKDFIIGAPWSLSIDFTDTDTTFTFSPLVGSDINLLASPPVDGSTIFPFSMADTPSKNAQGVLKKFELFQSSDPILFSQFVLQFVSSVDSLSGTINYVLEQRLYYTKIK